MGSFMGGSAPAMARQVCDGYALLSPNSLKRLELTQMKQLEFEMDKKLRSSRGGLCVIRLSRWGGLHDRWFSEQPCVPDTGNPRWPSVYTD